MCITCSPQWTRSDTAASPVSISFYERLPHAVEMLFVPAWLIGGSSAAKAGPLRVPGGDPARHRSYSARAESPRYGRPYCGCILFLYADCRPGRDSRVQRCRSCVLHRRCNRSRLGWQGLSRGASAGFCYGVKMTGIIAVPIAMAFFLARRQWRSAFVCATAAMLTSSPWLIRNVVETGNPFAPFFNRWFPNPYFYVLTEQTLTAALRSYGIPFRERFSELLAGHRLHGIIGPTFMIAPLALLALRRRSGAVLVALALIFSLPWWMNAGARFLMPALPFLTLAICAAIPFASRRPPCAARDHELAGNRERVYAPGSSVESVPVASGAKTRKRDRLPYAGFFRLSIRKTRRAEHSAGRTCPRSFRRSPGIHAERVCRFVEHGPWHPFARSAGVRTCTRQPGVSGYRCSVRIILNLWRADHRNGEHAGILEPPLRRVCEAMAFGSTIAEAGRCRPP